MKIATGGTTADTGDIRKHLEAVRHELRTPLGVLDRAEGHAEAAGDGQLADALANLTHRLVETRRGAGVHCCTPAPQEPSVRLSPHSAQASLQGDAGGAPR